MSRLSDHTYLQQCQQVRDLNHSFFLLTPAGQWALHMYFLPTQRLSDQQLLEHRQDINVLDPSLPQRAGRAFSKLKAADERLRIYNEQPRPSKKKGAAYEVRLMSEVQPVLDPAKYARILQNYEHRVDK